MTVSSISAKYWRGDQDTLRKLLLKDIKVPYKEFDGNIYSIRYPDKPLFVAHMDTVGVCKMDKPLLFKKNKLTRQNSGLGADDRAGINLIMNHHEHLNFLFTRDEETGRKGATSIAKHFPFREKLEIVSCIIQLDCTGHKVVRGAKHGYCQTDMMADLKVVIPDVKDSVGSYSDLDEFTDTKAGINLSVGYYKQHTKKEHLILTQYTYVDFIIPELNNFMIGDYKIPVKKVYKSYSYKPEANGEATHKVNTHRGYILLDNGYILDGIYYPFTTYKPPNPPPHPKVIVSEKKKAIEKVREKELITIEDDPPELLQDLYDDMNDDYEEDIPPFDCDMCGSVVEELTLVTSVSVYLCPICLSDLKTEVNKIPENKFDIF